MTTLLGGLDPATFLRRHWQKRPLLVRQAVPGFAGIVDREGLLALANRDDATSRLVIEHPRRRRRWERHDGPFGGLEASALPATRWTVLVHGVESLVPGGWELLRRFNFIPAARIDDLMVSYAADGGSVGPHDDKYDVFLLQGPGLRRWQVQTGGSRAVAPGAGMGVLRDFAPEDDWLLEPGDMLYLPPGVAHHGVAEGPCFTYSIGFLAPTHHELVRELYAYLAARLGDDAVLEDPDLRPARRPAALGADLVAQVAGIVDGVRGSRADIADFLGRYLTMPKPHVRFTPPVAPLVPAAFARRPVALALPSRALVHGRRFFLNGVSHAVDRTTLARLERLAAERVLSPPVPALLYDAYRAGAVVSTRISRSRRGE